MTKMVQPDQINYEVVCFKASMWRTTN